jgi:hypothetical protein
MMGGGTTDNSNLATLGTIMMSKTIENENTLGDNSNSNNTLDQISKLKNQLTFKEEELKNLRK